MYTSKVMLIPNEKSQWNPLEISPRQGIAHLNSVANFRRKGRDDLGHLPSIWRCKKVIRWIHAYG